jgi:hypothetical protein
VKAFCFVPVLLVLAACVSPSASESGSDAQVDAIGTATLIEPTEALGDGPSSAPRAPVERRPVRELREEDLVAKRYPAYGLTLYHMSNVRAAPDPASRIVGYMRRGSRFRASEEISRKGCAKGWFEVPGQGFVCNGDGFVVDSVPRDTSTAPTGVSLMDPLPYRYAKVLGRNVPQFYRLPSVDEERGVMQALALFERDAGTVASTGTSMEGDSAEALPAELSTIVRLRMQPGFTVSIDAEDGTDPTRPFLRTVRGGYVRADALVDTKRPAAIGVALGPDFTLPVAFVYRGGAPLLTRDPLSGEARKLGGDLTLHSAHALTAETVRRGGRVYHVTREGLLLPESSVRVVTQIPRRRPLKSDERWIYVDLDQQTLTAYEGDTPVFATLVSSGLPDHATPTGTFRLHAKHVTTTMADDLAADGPYSIEDVPWTMYFHGSYALHAAFWHERFGHMRSHGCVNLSPRDARWLFFWTLPELPSAWHGILAEVGKGTTVIVESPSALLAEQKP